jgi:glucose dehydrogenase
MFMVKDHVLYFCARGDAHQDLTAYDLSNGRKLWENRLPGLSRVCYSGAEPISDKVNLSIDEDVVNVASRNVCGDVMGIFDRKSGKTLAFRVVEDRLDECVRPKQTLDSKQ